MRFVTLLPFDGRKEVEKERNKTGAGAWRWRGMVGGDILQRHSPLRELLLPSEVIIFPPSIKGFLSRWAFSPPLLFIFSKLILE